MHVDIFSSFVFLVVLVLCLLAYLLCLYFIYLKVKQTCLDLLWKVRAIDTLLRGIQEEQQSLWNQLYAPTVVWEQEVAEVMEEMDKRGMFVRKEEKK